MRIEGANDFKQEFVARIGKTLLEKVKQEYDDAQKKAEMLGVEAENLVKEDYRPLVKVAEKTVTEDLTLGNNTALYSTVVAGFIEKAMRPELLAQGAIQKITLDTTGTNSIKIPTNQLLTASDLPDTGDVTYATSVDYGTTTITLSWKYAANKITYPLLQMANADLIADQVSEIGYALQKKVDSDIIAGVDSACTTGNSNLSSLGAGTYISYSAIVDAMEGMESNYGKPDILLTNPTTKARILKDTDIKSALAFGTVPQAGSILPQAQSLFGMKLLSSPQVSADTTYLIDSKECKYYVESSQGVQTFDGRVSGTVAQEVIGLIAYGVGVVKPGAVYKILENA